MSHTHSMLIGALAATTMLVWSGAGSAQTMAAVSTAAIGSGYSASEAPLGAPTQLQIDLQGRVAARCELVTPPSALSGLRLGRAGDTQAAFAIDCNAPFLLRVVSQHGGFANPAPTPGVAAVMPYEISVDIGTDTGRRSLGWCESAALMDVASSGCAFASSAGSRGWSSGDATAINETGALRLRWRDRQSETPLLGAYRDTIVIELEVRS